MGLSLEHMAQLSALLDSALELDPAGRQDWLDQLPQELAQYREALRAALLGGGGQSSGSDRVLLDTLPRLASLADQDAGARPQEMVGPYRLLQALGSGGMGTVWLAERSDGAYRRKVALKLPRRELAHGMLQRWSRERDILAALEHPHIARFYDAGVDQASGQPYLVLEYVEGQTLDRYVHGRDLRVRLELLLQVSDAVSYAHSAGVIHRDLKPGNILVDGKGQVHLLDFGIAKITEPEGAAQVTQLTEIGGVALTPDYASPEQLRGEALGPPSDVYSLGVILYAVLAGALPHDFRGRRTQAVANAMRNDDAPLASARATTPEARQALQGDLDAILALALRKNPDERYASVADFGADLRRFLNGEAVLARQQGRRYRLRKFLRRNRTALLGGLLLVGVSGGLGYGFKLLADQMHASEPPTIRQRMSIVVMPFDNQTGDPGQGYVADGLTTSLTGDLARIRDAFVVDPVTATALRDRHLTAREIGEQLGVRYVLNGSVQSSGQHLRVLAQLADARTNTQLWSEMFEGSPAELFQLQDRVTGRVGNSIGREMVTRGAREAAPSATPQLADLVLRARALEIQAATIGTAPRREALWRSVLELDANNPRAMASLAIALVQQGSTGAPGAPPSAKDAEGRDFALRARDGDPDNPDAYYALAIYYSHQRDFAAALEAARKRLALDTNSTNAFNLLGNLELYTGDPHQAVAVLERGLALDPDTHHPLDKLLVNLGDAYLLTGQFERSRDSLLRLQELEPLKPRGIAILAMDYAMLGDRDKARQLASEALARNPGLRLSSGFVDQIEGRTEEFRRLFQANVVPAWHRAGLPG